MSINSINPFPELQQAFERLRQEFQASQKILIEVCRPLELPRTLEELAARQQGSKPSPEQQRAFERLQAVEQLQQASQRCQKAALEIDRPPGLPEAARTAIEELAARRTETERLQNPDQAGLDEFVRSVVGTTVTDLAALYRDIRDRRRPVAERLQQLIKAIPRTATWTAQELANTLGCRHSSVVRSPWWRDNRAGMGTARVAGRQGQLIANSQALE